MEEAKKSQKKPCCCGAVLGVLVIVFAWWKISWAAIALTVLGAAVIAKEIIGSCCCKDKSCGV
ncbi:MAG: hypothetical protein WC352_06730 [Candidatus Omnitrophota bacterium]|jgi:hypothetical protein